MFNINHKCGLTLTFFIFCIIFLKPVLGFETVKTINLPEELSINFKKTALKRYISNLYKAKLSKSSSIKKKFKDWHSINISINNNKYEDGYFLEGKARISGDDMAHIDINNLRSTLKIKLKKGHISGVRVFRLIIPQAIRDKKSGDDEILWSILMEYLGFPTSYRKKIKIRLNDKLYTAIFEEGLEKEFIERWGFRESPIIRANETQFWYNRNNNLEDTDAFSYEISNKSFLKNEISNRIFMNGLSNNKFFRLKEFYELNSYFAKHGIAINNRRFLFDPIRNIKIPIYYDGEPKLNPAIDHGENRFTAINCREIKKIFNNKNNEKYIDFNRIKFEYFSRNMKSFTETQSCISKFIINKKYLWDKNSLQTVNSRNFEDATRGDYFDFKRKFTGAGKNIEINSLNSSLGLITNPPIILRSKKKFLLCLNNNTDCKVLRSDKIKKYLTGDGKPQILTNKTKAFPFIVYNPKNQIEENIIKIKPGNNKVILKNGVTNKIEISKKTKLLKILQYNSNDRLIITGETSEHFSLEVLNYDHNKINNEVRYNDQLLTGCVTFIDTKFNGGKLFLENHNCEDSLNILNSQGWIEDIKINNASNDGLDIDFSKLSINNTKIENSGNDCIDLSAGIYNFQNIYVSECNDKGLSIGENSRSLIDKINIKKSTSGVAVKDSSLVNINYYLQERIKKLCLDAYQKKQEFDGGQVKVTKTNCLNLRQDSKSSIKIGIKNNCLKLLDHHNKTFCLTSSNIKKYDFSCEANKGLKYEYTFGKKNINSFVQSELSTSDNKNECLIHNANYKSKMEPTNQQIIIQSKDKNGKIVLKTVFKDLQYAQ